MVSIKRSRFAKFGRRAKVAAGYERMAYARRVPIDKRTVLYESFAGSGMLCNPEAIFRALLAADDMRDLRHVWVLADLDESAATMAEFTDNPRVTFVQYKSNRYFAVLATAKYLVNNATFPPQFGKRDGQIYVNTWHGTPLKAMGYDVPNGALETRNIVRNFVSADYLLAPNEGTAEMYLNAYRMKNIYRGAIIQEGSPRVDKQFASPDQGERIKSRLRQHGVLLGADQHILLYAPTWKGAFASPTNDIRQLRARIDAISSQIDTNKYRLLLKVHQQVYKHACGDPELRELLVPNEIPANEVLTVTDVLITDYSSIFIDFLATGRPVLFYAPDITGYESSRGLNLPLEQWPGPVCRDIDQLVMEIKQLGSATVDPISRYAVAYAAARDRYCSLENGNAAARVIDIVFRDNADDYEVRRDFSDGRVSVLIHLGGMLANGITSSALSLLDNIDHDRFDVSVTFPNSTSPDRLRLIALINPRVRLFPRLGGINGSKLHVTPLLAVKGRSARQHQNSMSRHSDLLQAEWMRCFGASRFDHVVDFSGYAPFWVKFLGTRPSGSFSIWLHNDMRAEATNPGRTARLRANVEAVASLYSSADHLVSVSRALHEVNKKRLADCAPADKFTYARNSINFERIHHLAYGVASAPHHEFAGPVHAGTGRPKTRPPIDLTEPNPVDLPSRVDRLVGSYGLSNVRDEVERRATIEEVLPPAPGVRTFVTAGRLSTEKNQTRLIRAFDLVHQENPDTRLVILGTGPQFDRLTAVIDELGLASAVTLAGHKPNPYVVLANSDCFVLSSDYEGQPMVLLEALILQRSIVSTAFDSVRGALPEGSGLVVPREVRALADGMRAFLRGEVSTQPFDYVAYNSQATDEFYRAIGAA